MELKRIEEELAGGAHAEALGRLARSETGTRLAAQLDGAAAEDAVRRGDTDALASMMRSILSTPEGRRFAAQVQRVVDGHGR